MIASYGFGQEHPFGQDRHDVFHDELERSNLSDQVVFTKAFHASKDELLSYHTDEYIEFVKKSCSNGLGFLDDGDTPAIKGLFESASYVVGATLSMVNAIMAQQARFAFVPIGGLHHAFRDHAAGFCVFNDAGIAIEILRNQYGLKRIAYVDIDAHHGDGIFYAFEHDPLIFIADIHEDGRALFPGTGHKSESGKGDAVGTKLNIPLKPRANDNDFYLAWERIEAFVDACAPEFILFQCGADSIEGDPITHLRFSSEAHAYAAKRLCYLATRHASGRLLAMGGGGYNRKNLAKGWTSVVRELVNFSDVD
ncbi:MAG: acetoin utilization protein AcuC [Pseudomonadota bacterium]|nr:acetoin utilization protein AcuC [Pseudomonadota bacterium]